METEKIKMSPVTITGETISILLKEKNGMDLLALYVVYAEITQWQGNKVIRATNSFIMKRVGWGKEKMQKNRSKLDEMGLIKATSRYNEKTAKTTHFIEIQYVVNSAGATRRKNRLDAKPDISTSKYKVLSTSKLENSENPADFTVPPKNKSNSSLVHKEKTDVLLGADKKDTPPPDETLRLYYQVIKKYSLPVINNNHIKTWSKSLDNTHTPQIAQLYLTRLMEIDINKESAREDFVPNLTEPIHILSKSTKIITHLKKKRAAETAASDGSDGFDDGLAEEERQAEKEKRRQEAIEQQKRNDEWVDWQNGQGKQE